MDERTFQLYRSYKEELGVFTQPSALWFLKMKVKREGYTKAEMNAALAEIERQKVDTSPMVHLTQRQLDALLLRSLPFELQTSA
ncbi:hypothetical protein [Mesorhizobium sp. B2-3-10]|uniref:hypothetical protein n=1 Tax=Mesorhizobium sp. B2-3-10 TaxID=2589954 RepID=UPI00112C102C|nr:hypothetical protein [Mesorhizobium sp. B2-3-10]TPL94755.1 hypothetical protein FJ943_25050 [Mesorhizobium sp. B2-3-10]